jgi:hypothetical protein
MGWLRRFLRHAFELLGACVLAPVVGEYFIQGAKERGYYEHPWAWTEAPMKWFFALGADPTYRMIATFIVGIAIGMWMDTVLRRRDSNKFGTNDMDASNIRAEPTIHILFESREPYEVSEISAQGRVLSTVRIGFKATGKAMSNCRVYIEKIAPIPPLPGGGFPLLLAKSDFMLRHDEPVTMIDIASHWDHINQWRFNAPSGTFAETLCYIDDNISRVFELRIVSTEIQKTALFKIWTDESKQLHIKRM